PSARQRGTAPPGGHEQGVQIVQRLAAVIRVHAHPVLAVVLLVTQVPGGGARRDGEVDEPDEVVDVLRIGDVDKYLHPAIEVSVHEVGRTDEHVRLATVRERVDAGVFEVSAQDRADPDVVAQARNSCLEAADAAHDDIDGYPGLGGAVERIDRLF